MDPWIGPQNGWEQESWDLTESELRGGLDGNKNRYMNGEVLKSCS